MLRNVTNSPEAGPKSSIKATKTRTIAEKMADLDNTVEWFYGDDFVLDQALDKYKAASSLADEISKDLERLKNEVEVLEDFTKD